MAKNPAIPTKSRVSVNSVKGGCHFVLKGNRIISGQFQDKIRMHQVYIDRSQKVGGGL